MADNFDRMMKLVTEFFDTKNDPGQISMTEADRSKLYQIHPATMSELANEDGPLAWILMIPTTQIIMDRFLKGVISEKQLLEETKPGMAFDAIYLCSAAVLPEYRHKDMAKTVTVDAINNISKDHLVRSLFYWPFSNEGKVLAASVAKEVGLPLFEKK